MSDYDEKKDSSELTYLEARPFLVDIEEEDEEEDEKRNATSSSPATAIKTTNQGLSKRFWIAAAVNSAATVGIVRASPVLSSIGKRGLTEKHNQVFVNKSIFTNPSLRHCQVTFAAFHFVRPRSKPPNKPSIN